jgi:putative OPT family oligopeptide transporter
MAESKPETAPSFKPYIPDDAVIPELTVRALLMGSLFGLIFGGVTVYVGLRAGLTVSASIPIAVLSISLLRVFPRVPILNMIFGKKPATILENNLVQTTGSAGESVAGGVLFTLPALIFLGFDLDYWRILVLALIGGWLGVLFMIPLRRQLIVKEHGALLYPEGTACADVLVAGDKGGSFASRVFYGLGLGSLYTLLQNEFAFKVLNATPTYDPKWLPGASLRAQITPEYMGVGYIIGPRIAGVIFAGGVFSWLVMMPAIKFFGSLVPTPIYPSTIPIAQMTSDELWQYYIRYIGAGAVATAGLITLIKTAPTILSALSAGMADFRKRGDTTLPVVGRTSRDLKTGVVVMGSAAIVAAMCAFLTFMPIPGAKTGVLANLIAAVLVVVFGFLFVTVSSRIAGLIGTSSNPISGMAIATLMATCALFLLAGWTGAAYAALALSIGGSVCIAAANAGNTSQDLKTGFLVGATPSAQQKALFVGVLASCFAIGGTLIMMNKALEKFEPASLTVDASNLPDGVKVKQTGFEHDGRTYTVLNVIGSKTIAEGSYLMDPATGKIDTQWIHGIGSQDASAPQARLMSVVINGILNRKLPWGLVLLGVFLVITVELLGIRSLSFAVGSYLSIGTTAAIFCGGVIRWLAERGSEKKGDDETSPGALYASGLIAAGGIVGLLAIAVRLVASVKETMPWLAWFPTEWGKVGDAIGLNQNPIVALLVFGALGYSLFHFARKPMGDGK